MTYALTHFSKPPTVPSDCAEKTANVLLFFWRSAFGKTVTVVNMETFQPETAPKYLCNSRVIDFLSRAIIGIVAISIALPFTLAGHLVVLCSSTYKNTKAAFALSLICEPKDPPKEPVKPDLKQRMTNQGTLPKDAVILVQTTLQDLGPLPDDFEKTLQEVIDAGLQAQQSNGDAGNDGVKPIIDETLLQKVKDQNIVGHILKEAASNPDFNLSLCASALYFLNAASMVDLLRVLDSTNLVKAAQIDSLLIMEEKAAPLRMCFIDAIGNLTKEEVEASPAKQKNNPENHDFAVAGMFLAACPLDWVVDECGPNAWRACAEILGNEEEKQPLVDLALLVKNKYMQGSEFLRKPIQEFFTKISKAHLPAILAKRSEEGLPALMTGTDDETLFITALNRCPQQKRKEVLANLSEEHQKQILNLFADGSLVKLQLQEFFAPKLPPSIYDTRTEEADALQQPTTSKVTKRRRRRNEKTSSTVHNSPLEKQVAQKNQDQQPVHERKDSQNSQGSPRKGSGIPRLKSSQLERKTSEDD